MAYWTDTVLCHIGTDAVLCRTGTGTVLFRIGTDTVLLSTSVSASGTEDFLCLYSGTD
jgi:hypothetical protein